MSARQKLIQDIAKLKDERIGEVVAYVERLLRREELRADPRGILERLHDVQFDGPSELSSCIDEYVAGEKRADDLH